MFVCGVMITLNPPGGPGLWGTIKYSFDGSTYYTWPVLQSASLENINGIQTSYVLLDNLSFNSDLYIQFVAYLTAAETIILGCNLSPSIT